MKTPEINLDKLSFLFAMISVSAYWGLIFMGLAGLLIALINQLFWIFYFTKKHCFCQVMVNSGYLTATIVGLYSYL